MSDLLRISSLNAGYGKIPVLRDVTLQVRKGSVTTVVGSNGAGKSTLLKAISGLIKPQSGDIELAGKSITHLRPDQIARLGVAHVPEGGRPFPNMSVRDNVLMGAYVNRQGLAMGVLQDIYALFPILQDRQAQLARTLSGGEKQMLAMARSLASQPSLLMLDEPSLGLAPVLVDEIFEKVAQLRDRGMTVLLAAQNIKYALELADFGYLFENGSLVLEGTASDLRESSRIKNYYLGLA